MLFINQLYVLLGYFIGNTQNPRTKLVRMTLAPSTLCSAPLVAQTARPISLIIIPRRSYLWAQVPLERFSRVANKMWKFIMHIVRQILPIYRILLKESLCVSCAYKLCILFFFLLMPTRSD